MSFTGALLSEVAFRCQRVHHLSTAKCSSTDFLGTWSILIPVLIQTFMDASSLSAKLSVFTSWISTRLQKDLLSLRFSYFFLIQAFPIWQCSRDSDSHKHISRWWTLRFRRRQSGVLRDGYWWESIHDPPDVDQWSSQWAVGTISQHPNLVEQRPDKHSDTKSIRLIWPIARVQQVLEKSKIRGQTWIEMSSAIEPTLSSFSGSSGSSISEKDSSLSSKNDILPLSCQIPTMWCWQ